eukprot:Skav202037  [mRNA]  locus=scaffold1138:282094:284762:- [translate_table: standard]
MASSHPVVKALVTLETAQELLEAAGYPDNLAAGYFIQHGSAFARLKRFGEALQEFGKARDIFKTKHHDLQSVDGVTVSGNMAIAAAAVGRRKDAMVFFHEAHEGLDGRGDELGKARILSSMGAACVGSGAACDFLRVLYREVEQGLSHMKQGWQALLRAKLGDTLEGALLLSQMGSTHYQMALYSQARLTVQANMSFELARDRYFGNGNFREALRMWFLSFLASNVRGWLWDTEQSLYR